MGSLELLEEACERLPHTTKRMFGGHGLFAPNGGMFAGIVDGDRIVLKLADEKARSELCGLGTEPWTYEGKNGSMVMREWILAPDAFYDEPLEMAKWCATAHRLAPAKGAKKPAKAAKKGAARGAKKGPSARSGATRVGSPAKAGQGRTVARRPRRASHG